MGWNEHKESKWSMVMNSDWTRSSNEAEEVLDSK
jgi:hypothetical protein